MTIISQEFNICSCLLLYIKSSTVCTKDSCNNSCLPELIFDWWKNHTYLNTRYRSLQFNSQYLILRSTSAEHMHSSFFYLKLWICPSLRQVLTHEKAPVISVWQCSTASPAGHFFNFQATEIFTLRYNFSINAVKGFWWKYPAGHLKKVVRRKPKPWNGWRGKASEE